MARVPQEERPLSQTSTADGRAENIPDPTGAAATAAPDARADERGYRPQLDGIRAVAVVLVIAFHLGFDWIPGGFVGVDVFFVLSGYLITGLLTGELAARGTLRFGRFYARRARRLLPASVAVLVVCALLGHRYFDAVGRAELAGDLRWASLYSANWRFALADGEYFAAGDVPSPLVHYWSLAVEEQFYLVWPVLVFALFRLARRLRPGDVLGGLAWGLLPLTVLSAVASVALAGSSLTYYGTHTRSYQLLVGALVAVAVARARWALPDSARGRGGALALAVISLAALGFLAHHTADAGDYPGVAGLAVTAASVGLIVAVDRAPRTAVSALLASAPLAAVGRLSYSLYIWHWPVIVFAGVLGAGTAWDRWPAKLAVTVVVASASYLLLERPIRFRLRPQARPVWPIAVGLSCSVAVAVGTLVLFAVDGGIERRALAAVGDHATADGCPYQADTWPSADRSEPCVMADGSGTTVVLLGDSHGQQWDPAVQELASRHELRYLRATRGACPANDIRATAATETGQRPVDEDCIAWRRAVYPRAAALAPEVVLVATRAHVRGIEVDGRELRPGDAGHLEAWTAGWDWTLDTLASTGAQVVVSTIAPTMPERVPACLVDHADRPRDCEVDLRADTFTPAYNRALAAVVARHPGAVLVDPTSFTCPGGICAPLEDGDVVRRDDNHLTATWARQHASELDDLLTEAGITW